MALKVAGCLLLIASCTACGILFARRLYRRQKFLNDFTAFISALSTELRYSGEEICVLVKKCGECAGFSGMECFEMADENAAFFEMWGVWVKGARAEYCLSKSDAALLCDFGAPLGVTDLEGQLEHLRHYSERFEALLEQSRSEAAGKAKLYRLLGFCAGCSAALVIV